MKIVIAGQAKSGTTALFFKVKQALPAEALCLFEPHAFEVPVEDERPILAKVLVDPPGAVRFETFRHFEKKVLLVRDPRDNLISRVLYRVYGDRELCADEARVEKLLASLRQKEADAGSVSLLQIMAMVDPAMRQRVIMQPANGLRFHLENPDYFVYRYEDLVAGQFILLEGYLGMKLDSAMPRVPDEFRRVSRTNRAGDWRNWLTEEDVSFFRPHLAKYMDHHGYPDDWELASQALVRPEHASQYVMRLIAERLAIDAKGDEPQTPEADWRRFVR